jgi:hypothetical protein
MFAPHVGVGYSGKVGALERDGIQKTSSACGAAVGAYKLLSKPETSAPQSLSDLEELEFEYIQMKLEPRLNGVEASADQLSFVTYQMYDMVKDAVLKQIYATPGLWDDCSELAVLGGVQINRMGAPDMFQPLMFQTISNRGLRTDLYADTFGQVPQITPVVGSSNIASSVLLGNLDINTKVLNKNRVDNIESQIQKLKSDLVRFESGEDIEGFDLDDLAMGLEGLMQQLSTEQRKQKLVELRKLIDTLATDL